MPKNTFVFALFFFLLTPWGLNAQSSIFSGKVISNNGGIEFAKVKINDINRAVVSDSAGHFKFQGLPAGTYKYEVNAIGYVSHKGMFKLSENESLIKNITLIENKELDNLVVSGTMKEMSKVDCPIPVEVYTAKFFKANPTPSLFESMQNVNGVRPQLNCNVCNTGDIHINGLEGPYTMILIDGMPIVSGLSTVYGLTGIPQALIERVEIVKGPASTLYGSEAVGGLVNVITRKPNNAPIFTADIFSSNWLDVNTDLGFKFNVGKKVQSLVGINYFNYQNKIDNNNDHFTDVTLQDRISIFNKWTVNRKHNRLFSFAARYIYEDRWGGEMNWTPEFRGGDSIYGESIYTNRWELFGTYQLPFQEKVMLQFSGNGHDQNSVYGNTIYNATQYIGFGQLTWFKSIGKRHEILLGAAYRYTYYDDNTAATALIDSIGSKSNPSIIVLPGIFIQDDIKINEQHQFLLGMRYDKNSIHGNVFTPRLSYKFNSLNKKNILRIGGGNGYRVANVFTEDHAALTGARTVEFMDELKPETSWNANVNFEKKHYIQNKTYVGIDVTGFYTYFTNKIIPDYETDPNKIIYSNLNGNSISKGVSLNLDVEFDNGLKILVGGTLMDVSFTESGITKRQLLTEQFSGVWSAAYTFHKHALTIDYTGNLYGPMRLPVLGELDDRMKESPVWSLQNIQITKKFNNGFEIYGGVKNLLNYTPPANSIARAFDPFDKEVQFDTNGNAIATPNNPNALTFDPSYVFAPNQGIRGFLGLRYMLK